MITVEHLTKSFGSQILFQETSFRVNPGERVGLVGLNGHGKTTLLRLIVGEELADAGSITMPKHYRIGYVRQELDFTEETVLQEGMKGLSEQERGYHWKVEKILAGLGFLPEDMERHPSTLSGGFQVRLNLVKVLVSDPDVLLLDEPTNYLDITSIRWVTRFLLGWPHELIVVTHDRSFMDKIVTHVMGIHRRRIRKVAGDTERYYTQIAQEEEIYEKTRLHDEQRRKDVELFISRFRAKARLANLVQSRIKTLSKMDGREKLERIKTLEFSFRVKAFRGKYVLRARDLSFSYERSKPLIRGFDIAIGARDRVCIVGPNGRGKTTLLRLLAGTLVPSKGMVDYSQGVASGVFEQTNTSTLVDSRTVEEEILAADGTVDRQMARNICGVMLFEGDAALKKIRVLSGGEKSRVMLGQLLARPVNLLLLDEPTNHLDMESCDALLVALDNFEGAVVMVTHNEMFLNGLAERLVVFRNGGQFVFDGSYQQFLEREGWGEDQPRSRGVSTADEDGSARNRRDKRELRRQRSEITRERSKTLKPLEKEIARVEHDIMTNERRLSELNARLLQASRDQDGARIVEYSQGIHQCEKTIDTLFDQLDKLTTRHEQQQVFFDAQVEELETIG